MDTLRQTAAISSAILGVEKLIPENRSKHGVESAISSGDPQGQRAKFDELVGLLQRASRSAFSIKSVPANWHARKHSA